MFLVIFAVTLGWMAAKGCMPDTQEMEIYAKFGFLREECPPSEAVRMLAEEATRAEGFERLAAWHATIPPLELSETGFCRDEWLETDAAILVQVLALELAPRDAQMVNFLYDHVSGHCWSRSFCGLLEELDTQHALDWRRELFLGDGDSETHVFAAYAREARSRIKLGLSSQRKAVKDYRAVLDFLRDPHFSYEDRGWSLDHRLAFRWVERNHPSMQQ